MSETQPFILSPDGNPFTSEAAAKLALKNKDLDEKVFHVQQYRGGWAIVDVMALMAEAQGKKDPKAPERVVKYQWGIFTQKTHPNDTPYVPLFCNGMQIHVQRGKQVCLPDFMWEIAAHASHKNWVPGEAGSGQTVRAEGETMRYPFTIVKDGKKEEFESQLAKGNEITNQYIERMRRKGP